MSKEQSRGVEEFEEGETLAEVYEEELSASDYGFIFDRDGDLKAVFFPSDYYEIPEKMLRFFKMCGINDPEELNARVSTLQ